MITETENQQKNAFTVTLLFKDEAEIKTFLNKKELKEYLLNKLDEDKKIEFVLYHRKRGI